jgi:hypothetical protein
VAFGIARSIFSLAVGLILRLAVNLRTRRQGTLVVGIDVIHMHDEATAGDGRRVQVVFRGHAVQPDRDVSRTHLAVDWLPFRVPLDTAGLKPERVHEEIVRRRYILVDQKWDDPFDYGNKLEAAVDRSAKMKRRMRLAATKASDTTHKRTSIIRRYAAVVTETPIPVKRASQAATQMGHFGRSAKVALGRIHPAISPLRRHREMGGAAVSQLRAATRQHS